MVDTWATVGSCAQIGKGVHLSGGVGIGGVLEPPQASPVIVEDGAFIGSRCIVVEGVRVEREAVLGAGVVLDGEHSDRRRSPRASRYDKGRDSGARSRDSGNDSQAVPSRRIRRSVRADHRNAERGDRSKNVAQCGASRVRGRSLSESESPRYQRVAHPGSRCEEARHFDRSWSWRTVADAERRAPRTRDGLRSRKAD